MVRFHGAQRAPSAKVELFVARDFLDVHTCAGLIERIDVVRRPSTLTDHDGDPGFRTSETGDLDAADPLVARVRARLAAYAALDLATAEPLQGQRYAVGQEFKPHTDYFEPRGLDYAANCARAGQRTWTLMVYLNKPAAGGTTRFKRLDKIFAPETGKLLAWNNLTPDGQPNDATLHQGLPVRAGTKYIITAWFRERAW